MAGEDEQQDADHWRWKYRQQIAELDRLESEWQANETILRRAISRLGRCAMGHGPNTDQAVEELEAGIRAGSSVDELAHQAERIAAALARGEQAPSDEPSDEPTAATRDEPANRRRVYLELVGRLADQISDGDLQTLRGNVERARTEADLEAARDALIEWLVSQRDQASPAPLADTASNGSAESGASELTSSHLLALLERIEVPVQLRAMRDELRERLRAGQPEADSSAAVDEVADLIGEIRGHLEQRQHEVQEFLGHVTGRIEQIGSLLDEQTTTLGDQAERGRVFNADLTQELNSLRSDLADAEGLDQVKEAVDQRLDDMSTRILEYGENQQAALAQARDKLQQLGERVSDLEREAYDLRNALEAKDNEALTDTLTGLPNRQAYDQRVLEEFQRWQRFGTHLALALFDVDHFKAINDTYGHRAGDKALHAIAQLLHSGLRRVDFLARYGGEEFVALLPGTTAEGGQTVVDRLLARVASSGFHYDRQPVAVSLSAGVTHFGLDDTIETVIDRADQGLYAAKELGRNGSVVRYPPDADN